MVSVFVITFGAFVISLGYTIYYYLHGRFTTKKESADPRDLAVHEAVKIVDAARSRAMEMLGEAHAEAKTLLEDSEDVHSSVKETFDKKIEEIGQKQVMAYDLISKELVDSYKAVIGQEKDSSLRSLADITNTLKSELTGDVGAFKDRIRTITNETENHIKTDLEAQYLEISKNLASLKENLQKVTQNAEQEVRSNVTGQYNLVETEIANFANTIKAISNETGDNLKSELNQEYTQAKAVVSSLSGELKKVVEETGNELKKAVEETENELKQGVKAEYDQIRQELDNYKKDRYQKIDGVVRGMLEEVARDVLGKTMNAKDHEELIIRSLDSIKRTTNLKEL